MNDVILVPFAPILVESTRSIGYSFEAALADIIDNSIGKGAKEINVNFSSIEKPYIAIIDDACGMDEEELQNAMRYGSKSSLDDRDDTDLGRFGLGLKMASLSQCRKLTVISKKNGKICASKWDLDYIVEKGNWSLICYNQNEIAKMMYVDTLKNQESGTIVIWEDFDRILNSASNLQKALDEKIDLASAHIALVFHRFIGNENIAKKVKIFFNGAKIEAVDPFLTSNAATQPLVEQTIRIDDKNINVKPYILPYISKMSAKDKKELGDINDLRKNQGFYVYRNKRLIIWGTWFRLLKQYELNKLARIRVDIPNSLDSIWEIDVKKSSASLPNKIKRNLIAIVERTVGKSEKVYKYRGRKTQSDKLEHVWNIVDNRGNFNYLINRELPIFKSLEDSLDENGQNCLNLFVKLVETSFPYGDVYYRSAKNESPIKENKLESEEVYDSAVKMIEYVQKSQENVQDFLSKMDKYDCFAKYPEIVEKIREVYGNE